MMDFEFVIYDTPQIIVNDVRWYLAPFYDYEINMLAECFKENIDYICYVEWNDGPYEGDDSVNGTDVLISSKVFTWLSLKYGQVSVDIFSDMEKFDTNHYKFSIEDITKTIQEQI